MPKQKWCIYVSQNGWEYTGTVIITASKVVQVTDQSIMADGVLIEFDELIEPPTKQE